MAHHRISSLDGRGIADFDELIHKKIHRILRSCLIALYFDPTTLIKIAVYKKFNWSKTEMKGQTFEYELFRVAISING